MLKTGFTYIDGKNLQKVHLYFKISAVLGFKPSTAGVSFFCNTFLYDKFFDRFFAF